MREVVSSCRACNGQCGMVFTLDGQDRVLKARGDHDNPVTKGYACLKGLHLHEAHYSPRRLLAPLKRMPDGTFRPIPLTLALDEIAERIGGTIGRHGPDSVGAYKGTLVYGNYVASAVMPAWLKAIGSRSWYTSVTIDQSAKWIASERLGTWEAGWDPYELADALMLVGVNPLVSLGAFNVRIQNPAKGLREAKARGVRLVVVDPRLSETAKQADVHLQLTPGEDPTLFAGLLRIILKEGWQDQAFCDAHVADLEALRAAVEPFDPQYVAARAGVAPDKLRQAAEVFAKPIDTAAGPRRKRGACASGTGPDMTLRSNLSEHLIQCVNIVCGRFARAGDPVPNPGVLAPRRERRARVIPPARSWARPDAWTSPITGYPIIRGEKMTGAMPDEIVADHPEKLRALFCVGGNLVNAMTGQRAFVDALKQIELLVVVDPFMTTTAQLAHYILPPPMMLERPDLGPMYGYEDRMLFEPYAQYVQQVIAPPEGADLIDDWAVFWELSRRLGTPMTLGGVRLEGDSRPGAEEMLDLVTRDAPVPMSRLRRYPQGHVFEVEPMTVLPAGAEDTARFQTMPADVAAELAQVRAEAFGLPAGYTHRLTGRRMRDVVNSTFRELPVVHARHPYNPAYLHPDDMAALGVQTGEMVAVRSAHGQIPAIVEADPTIRPGVVALTHGWGGLPGEQSDPRSAGSNTNLLTSSDQDRQYLNAMPVMGGFPVRIEKAGAVPPEARTPTPAARSSRRPAP